MSHSKGFGIPLLLGLLVSLPALLQAQGMPTGRFYFGAGNTDYNSVIFESNLDASNTVALSGYQNGSGDLYPSVSRDGSLIAFASNKNSTNYHVWVMNKDGSGRRQLTFDDPSGQQYDSDQYPVISPDGSKIAFSSNRAREYDGFHHPELYVIKADGTGFQQLTNSDPTLPPNNTNFVSEVAWGPDSKKILFRGFAPWTDANGYGAKEGIYTIQSTGLGLTQIVGGFGVGHHTTFILDWSHDGRYIEYRHVDNGGGTFVHVRDLSTNAETQFETPPLTTDIRFSPDGSRMAFSRRFNFDLLITDRSGNIVSSMPEMNFFSNYSGFNLNADGFWWQDADPIPAPASLSLPPAIVYANLGQLVPVVPVLKDAAGGILAQVPFDATVTSIGGWTNYSGTPDYNAIFYFLSPYQNRVQGNGITSGPYRFTAHNAGLAVSQTILWGQPNIQIRMTSTQRFGDGSFRVFVTPYDTGNARVTQLSLTGISMNGIAPKSTGATFFADLGPGDFANRPSTFLEFAPGVIPPSGSGILKIQGTYPGGSFVSSLRITVP